jgi:hypothetical protein
MTSMSIDRNIEIENDVDLSKHRDQNGLIQSKVIVISCRRHTERAMKKWRPVFYPHRAILDQTP